MKYAHAAVALLPLLLLGGCGDDPKAATESNFKKAINTHYAKHCIVVGDELSFSGSNFPMKIELQSARPDAAQAIKDMVAKSNLSSTERWDALVKAGLLTRTDGTSTRNMFGSVEPYPIATYALTAKGKSAFYKVQSFCAGHLSVDTIDHFSEPSDIPFGGFKASEVVFTTKPSDVPQWALDPAVQKAWPQLADALKPDTQRHLAFIQSNKGWIEEHDFGPGH